MAISSVHFEPTTQTYGDLNIVASPQNILHIDMSARQRRALVNLLIGLGFVLAFFVALSALYLGDQALFTHSGVVTASQPPATYNGMPIDYD
jgi:hypothetical protein